MSHEPPAPPSEPPKPPIPPSPPRQVFGELGRQALLTLRTGWMRAAVAAAAVLATVYVLNLLLGWLQSEAGERLFTLSGTSSVLQPPAGFQDAPSIPRTALFGLMAWHGVSFDASFALPAGELPFGTSVDFSVTFTLMLGLAITGALLCLAGRLTSRGTDGWLAGIRGLQIALVYAIVVLILGFLAGIEVALPELAGGDAPQSIEVRPSLLGAFWMPFLLAALVASAAAVSGRLRPGRPYSRLALAGVTGGWRAAWLSVALASIGFLIVAALNPDETRAFLDLLPGGVLTRALLVVSSLLVVPNVGTGISAASMGGSINLAALGDSCAVISFLKFPRGVVEQVTGTSPGDPACGLPLDLGFAPVQYLLFLLVPVAATVAGGWLAAQRSGSGQSGAIAGMAIALPFAVFLWLLGLVARIGYAASAGFFPFAIGVWIGPGLLSTVLLSVVWGTAGGAIGGALGARYASGPGTSPGPQTNVAG